MPPSMRLNPRTMGAFRVPVNRPYLCPPHLKPSQFSTTARLPVVVTPIPLSSSNPIPGRLANKIAIVTGSSAGIGRAIALAFAREGAKVVCSDLHPVASVNIGDETHIATHDKIMRENGTAVFVKTDVGEADQVEELVHQGAEIFGRVDMSVESHFSYYGYRVRQVVRMHGKVIADRKFRFVNNAGVALELGSEGMKDAGQSIHETPLTIFDRTMRINARGTFLGCKYAISQMLKQDLHPSGDRGWIINLASVAGLIGFSGAPAYCASKGAIVELTRQVAVDYGKDKIHVNAICPGVIETAMVKSFTDSIEVKKKLQSQHPWGNFGKPEDVGKVAVFLASSDAAFVTGTLLPVDGGFVAE